ncbi:MAG: TIM barrel protein [Chloroflexota bacterium]|nr:TIM barrel protein [Chloroflexota bacterium]
MVSSPSNIGFHCHSLADLDEAILSNGLKRGEFYNFPVGDLPYLYRRISEQDLVVSIHSPLERLDWYPSPPTFTFLCDADVKQRWLSLRMIEVTMQRAQDFNAEYVVVHFPSPQGNGSDGMSYDDAFEIAWHSAMLLQEMSEEYETPIHIEGFGPSPFLNTGFLIKVITEFPGLRYCFDAGHMHIASKQFGFDLYQFACDIAPHVGSMHIWNNRGIDDYRNFRHIPVHPRQDPREGWVDIPRLMNLILSENDNCRIILESGLRYPLELGGYDIREGVKWVRDIVSRSS